jgi:hypothetical protein
MQERPPLTTEDGRELAERKTSIYKAVEIFSGMLRKRLWVKDGPLPCTDGREIQVPFNNPDAYLLTEHELAHNLFRSNPQAKERFVTEYTGKVTDLASSTNVKLEKDSVRALVEGIVQTMEDYRVESLWQVLYPGSFHLRQELVRRWIAESDVMEGVQPKTLIHAFLRLSYGVPIPDGEYKKFEPTLVEALSKVRRRGFPAMLVMSRWLITELVNDLIREAEKASKAPIPPPDDGILAALVGPPPPGWGSGTSDESTPDKEETLGPVAGTGDIEFTRDPKARSEVLRRLLKIANALGARSEIDKRDDLKTSKFLSDKDRQNAENIVEQAVRFPVHDGKTLADFLDKSERRMQEIVDWARDVLFKQMKPEEVLQKGAMAKVVVRDALPEPDHKPLTCSEREAVRRLQTQFLRQMGRSRMMLDNAGAEVDNEALIQNVAFDGNEPCFRKEVLGRGFRGLVLIDRSGSMSSRQEASEEACRVLGEALLLPFVVCETWGWQSLNDGQIDVTRFGKRVRSLTNRGAGEIHGTTPLHIAIRLGVRHLMAQGADAKHLFVVTDGEPVYSTKAGVLSSAALVRFVHDEVRFARSHGVDIVGVMIDALIQDDVLGYMFGDRRHWKRVRSETLAADLVQLISSSFLQYLKNR